MLYITEHLIVTYFLHDETLEKLVTGNRHYIPDEEVAKVSY